MKFRNSIFLTWHLFQYHKLGGIEQILHNSDEKDWLRTTHSCWRVDYFDQWKCLEYGKPINKDLYHSSCWHPQTLYADFVYQLIRVTRQSRQKIFRNSHSLDNFQNSTYLNTHESIWMWGTRSKPRSSRNMSNIVQPCSWKLKTSRQCFQWYFDKVWVINEH